MGQKDEYADLFDAKGQILDDRVEDLLVEVESGKHLFHSPSPTRGYCARCARSFDMAEQCPTCGSWEVGPEEVLHASRCPTGQEQAKARIIYTRKLDEAKGRGILTRADLEQLAIEQGLFDENERAEKKSLLSTIEKLMKKREITAAKQQKLEIDAQLEQMRKRVLEITLTEATVFRNSAESVAEEHRTSFFVWNCTTSGEMLDEQVWPSAKDYQSCDNDRLLTDARRALIRVSYGLPTKVIRALARCPVWRQKWKTAKGTNTTPFDGSISTWDRNKLNLIYWSDFYDCVYQHPEKPDEETIQNDELLGEWLTQQAQKVKQAQAQQRAGGLGFRHPSQKKPGFLQKMHHLGDKTIQVRQPFKIRTGNEG